MARIDAKGRTKGEARQRARMIRYVVLFMVTLLGLITGAFVLSQTWNSEQPAASLACAAKVYSSYDPKNLEQCMAVCMACNNGLKTTCSASCALKGAR